MEVDQVQFSERVDRTRYLVDAFGEHLTSPVLDVGCDTAPLRELRPDLDYTGIDVGGQPDHVMNLETTDLPWDDGQFGCVVCCDVLEHLDNLHHVFDELLRVSSRHVIISLPNNWQNARVPIARGRGSFKHYGLPADRPPDRHACEKPRPLLVRLLRRARHSGLRYINRYTHTYWVVLRKSP